MRILLYTETALPKVGGQEMVVDALARQFLALGHDPVVLATHPRLPLRARDQTLPYSVARHPRFYSTTFLVNWYRWFLIRLRRSFAFDVVHCHGIYPTGYVASLGRSRWPGVPTVITSHGGDVQENSARLEKPRLVPRRLASVAAADALVAISGYTRAGFLRLGADPGRIVDLPNGVDLDGLTRPAARPEALDAGVVPGNYFLFLGRLHARKGVDILLEALARQPARGGVEVVIAGGGEERAALEQQAAFLGLLARVRFAGPVQGGLKAYLLQNARCLVVPSRRWEAFGLVVLEGFAARIPVIATRLPGMQDLVDPRRTGWLVAPESCAELAEAMNRVWSLGAESRRIGEAGFRIAEQLSWPAVARRHLALYEERIAACRARTVAPRQDSAA